MGNNARVLTSEQRPQFVTHYNRSSFAFDHSLHLLDIFDVPQLVAMSGRLPDQAYYSTADSVVSDGWKHVGERRAPLAQTLETLSETNSLVLLKHCEKDSEYGGVFRRLMDEVVEQVGDELRSDLDVGRATLVISSPRRVTSYHIDAEVNFLLQVRGRKLLHAFDPSDRRILTESELEAFYGGDSDGARYKSDRQSEARVFALTPGMGIHLPLHAPHWAQNLDDVSVGVSLNFNLRSGTRLAKLYKVNNRLRRAGMAPASPGVSAWLDSLKLAAFDGASHCRQLVRHRSVKAALS
jgi:hypothetical protein